MSKRNVSLEMLKKEAVRRDAEVVGVDVAARTVEISFSSEAEVPRWYGFEVLSHDIGAVDLSRLNDGAAVLWNHNWDDMRGVVESARIDSDRKGRAILRMSKSEAGETLLQDIADRIVTKISVGYFVLAARLQEERGDDQVWVITQWQPYEISWVSVPADTTVGLGRSSDIPHEAPIQTREETSDAPANVPANEIEFQHIEAHRQMDENERKRLEDAARQNGLEAERTRMAAIFEMGKQYRLEDMARQAVQDGKTVEEFRVMALQHFNAHINKPLDEQVRNAEIGMTENETKRYSFIRAIRAQLPNASKADRDAAGFELECSLAAQRQYGKSAKGYLIPMDVLNQRTFSVTAGGGSGTGAGLVATTLKADSFIELLRHRAWVMQRATIMGGLVGNVDIPRQNAANAAYWVGEGGAPTAGQPGIDQISFSPKTLGAWTDITRNLLKQATPDAENIVRNDLLKVMALELDRVALYGTGSNAMPTGVKNMTGINAVLFAAANPTYAELVEMETAIALDDADVESMVYAANAGFRGYAKTALKFPGTAASGTIWEPGQTVNGYDTAISNQIVSGDVWFGNWADLIIAMWGGLDLTVDPYSLSTTGGTRIVTFQDIDVNARHVQSFCYGANAAP